MSEGNIMNRTVIWISILTGGIILVGIMTLITTTIDGWHNRKVKHELNLLFDKGANREIDCCIDSKEIEALPEVVQRYLNYSQLKGNRKIFAVRLKQKGTFSLYPDPEGKSFEAEQYFRGDEPAFLWIAKFGSITTVKDKYMNGTASMQARLFNLFTVMNAKDEKLAQGALARYFSEMIWFPSSYLLNDIQWKASVQNTFTGTINHNNITVLGHFEIDEKGALIRFSTDRYMEVDGDYQLEKWTIEASDYREVDGYKIPFKGRAIWNLEEGDYEYINLEIEEIQYTIKTPF